MKLLWEALSKDVRLEVESLGGDIGCCVVSGAPLVALLSVSHVMSTSPSGTSFSLTGGPGTGFLPSANALRMYERCK